MGDTIFFAAIRKCLDTGDEWIDIETVSCLSDQSRDKAELTDAHIKQWGEANPVQRIAQVSIVEVKTEEPAQKCSRCNGCGQIANDDEGSPWTFWKNLPVESAAAVLMGLVKPIPCPDCSVKKEKREVLIKCPRCSVERWIPANIAYSIPSNAQCVCGRTGIPMLVEERIIIS